MSNANKENKSAQADKSADKSVEKLADKSPRPRKERVHHSARARVEAVLSVWTARRRPSEVCQQMQINNAALSQWEEKALLAMLEALSPQTRAEWEMGPSLNPKLSRLLARQASVAEGKLGRLEKRLEQLQQTKS